MSAEISDESTLSTWSWWESRRLRYNFGLLVAGIVAFLAYILILFTLGDRIPDVEITLFTIGFQGVGYFFYILVANVFYCLGALSEELPRMRDLASHRRMAFGLGFWLSVALPFLVPLLLAYYALFQPEAWEQSLNP